MSAGGYQFKLRTLNLRGNLLNSQSFKSLSRFLTHVRQADLSENPLRDIFFQELFLDISTEMAVSELVLQSCLLTERAVTIITMNLNLLPNIKTIDFSFNELEEIEQFANPVVKDFYRALINRKRNEKEAKFI